jgi:hypothetical protein
MVFYLRPTSFSLYHNQVFASLTPFSLSRFLTLSLTPSFSLFLSFFLSFFLSSYISLPLSLPLYLSLSLSLSRFLSLSLSFSTFLSLLSLVSLINCYQNAARGVVLRLCAPEPLARKLQLLIPLWKLRSRQKMNHKKNAGSCGNNEPSFLLFFQVSKEIFCFKCKCV